MITRNCLIVPLGALAITFSSEIALAIESTDTGQSIAMWPIIVAVAVLIILRKQLIAEATSQKQEHDEPDAPKEKIKVEATKAKTGNIDLKDGSGQCQANTVKGTRCRGKSNLTDASITIDGTSYDLTVCRQHNNDTIKPFSELIK